MKLTMRNSLVVTISLMGLLVIGFALIVGGVFTKLSLDNRAATFEKLAELEVHYRWHKVRDEAVEMGLSIRQDLQRKHIIKEQDSQKVVNALNEHFHRGDVTLGLLDLKKLSIYDQNLEQLWSSSEGVNNTSHECPGFLEKVAQRTGSDRLKSVNRICSVNDELRLVVLMPLGGLRVEGYLSMVINPVKTLSGAEKGLGIPLTILSLSGKPLYRSAQWPTADKLEESLSVSYSLHAGNPETVAEFRFVTEVAALREQLNETRYMIVLGAVLITALVVFIALGLLNRMIIKPLAKITKHMRRIRKDNTYLKEAITVTATVELEELANDLNAMSSELDRLYGEMEVMAFTDDLTGIPNRALLFERLGHTVEFANRDQHRGKFILMMMDLNRFKEVNDTLGHNVGDRLLQEVAVRLTSATRSSDTIARLGGDEFAMLMYTISDEKDAQLLAEKITSLMSQEFLIDGHSLDVGMSIGISCYPNNATSVESLMHCADMAMYYAKQHEVPFAFYNDDVAASLSNVVRKFIPETASD